MLVRLGASCMHLLRRHLVGLALTAIVFMQAIVFAQSVPAAASSDYDEGVYLASVDALRHGQALGTQVFTSQPLGWYNLLELVSLATGRSVEAWRVAMLVIALGGTLAAYMVGRLLAGKCAGLTAAALLGLGPNYAEFTARIVADIPALTFTLTGLALSIVGFTRRRPGVAVAAGAVLTAAVSIKLTAVTVVPTIVALTLTQRARLRDIAAAVCGAAATAALLLLPHLGALAPLWRGAVTVHREIAHLATVPSTGANRYQLRQAYFHHGETLFFWLELAGALAFLLLLRQRRWSLWPLWLWTAAAAVAVEETRPLQANHYTLLSAAIALPAGASIGALLASIPRGSVQTIAGVVVAAVIATGYVRTGEHLAAQPQRDGPEVAWAVANLRSHSRPREFVATDRPILAYLADRRLPGDLVDTSFLRFDTRSLTPSAVLTAIDRYKVAVALTARGFRKDPSLVRGLRRRFPRQRQFDGVTLYFH
jgi:Dolichyl-phosphate-mannose-protein mannosyltransferase